MRPEDRSENVVRRRRRGDPVAHGLVDRVLQRARAAHHGHDRRAEKLHPVHVQRLTLHVDRPHVDDTREPEERARGGRRDAVLAGAGFRDDARLAHPHREEGLAEGVVDLVSARVEEILAFEKDPRAAEALREPLRVRERRRPAGVRLQEIVQLAPERGIAPRVLVRA